MRENLKTIRNKDMEHKHGLTEIYIKDNFQRMKSMGKVFMNGKMEENMKVSGQTVYKMALEGIVG